MCQVSRRDFYKGGGVIFKEVRAEKIRKTGGVMIRVAWHSGGVSCLLFPVSSFVLINAYHMWARGQTGRAGGWAMDVEHCF